MIDIKDKSNCCGCGACVLSCPKRCISLYDDNEGFLYPHVNVESCVDCGLCEKVCPVAEPYDERYPLQTFAAINKDENVRIESSSGGIFTMIAEQIIAKNGIVFGARFDDNWQVVLDYTSTVEGLSAFRGSKYVQARTEDTFKQCRDFLNQGRNVLFSGTPCQIAGLKHFLRKDYENLLTVDFVCHGIPSPKVWAKYLSEVVKTLDIKGISMRDKRREGWKRFNFVIDYDEGNSLISLSSWHKKNDFMNAFLQDVILRPSCYNCKSKEFRSHSDITIADFWGIHKVCPDMDDDKGTGLVLVHSERGRHFFPTEKVHCKEVSFEEGSRSNPAIYRSAKPWPRRNDFFSKLDSKDSVIELIRDTLKPSLKTRIIARIVYIKHIPKRIAQKVYRIITGGGKSVQVSYNGINGADSFVKNPSNRNMIKVLQAHPYKIDSIIFRSKDIGWSVYQMKIQFREKE